MILKIFKVIWFLSVMALFATLLYNYAGWQEQLVVQEEGAEAVSMSREVLFYTLVGLFAIVNVLVYLISRMFPREENFRTWFHGLIVTINIFFIIAMSLIGVYNSTERFDYSRIDFIVYGSVGLIVCWAVAWPVYALCYKFFFKQAV
jgi:uncharacterized membrane protein